MTKEERTALARQLLPCWHYDASRNAFDPPMMHNHLKPHRIGAPADMHMLTTEEAVSKECLRALRSHNARIGWSELMALEICRQRLIAWTVTEGGDRHFFYPPDGFTDVIDTHFDGDGESPGHLHFAINRALRDYGNRLMSKEEEQTAPALQLPHWYYEASRNALDPYLKSHRLGAPADMLISTPPPCSVCDGSWSLERDPCPGCGAFARPKPVAVIPTASQSCMTPSDTEGFAKAKR